MLGKSHQDPIFLSWGRPSESTPDIINNYVIHELRNNPDVGKYTLPHGLPELRETIAKYQLENRGYDPDPDSQIIVTVGAMEAMFITMQTLLNQGDEVIMTSPGFASYIQQIKFAGGVAKYSNLDEENGWDINIDSLRKSITDKTKAIILTSPNNPTGSVFSEEKIRAVSYTHLTLPTKRIV